MIFFLNCFLKKLFSLLKIFSFMKKSIYTMLIKIISISITFANFSKLNNSLYSIHFNSLWIVIFFFFFRTKYE